MRDALWIALGHYNAKSAKNQQKEAYDAGQHIGISYNDVDEVTKCRKRGKRRRGTLKIKSEYAFHGPLSVKNRGVWCQTFVRLALFGYIPILLRFAARQGEKAD